MFLSSNRQWPPCSTCSTSANGSKGRSHENFVAYRDSTTRTDRRDVRARRLELVAAARSNPHTLESSGPGRRAWQQVCRIAATAAHRTRPVFLDDDPAD